MRIKSGEEEWVLKTKPAVSNRAHTHKTHLEGVKEFLLDRALTFSSQNESISIVGYLNISVNPPCKTKEQIKEKQMHLILIRNLRKDAAQYPDVKNKIDSWNATVKQAEWQNLEDVRKIYRDAEAVGNFTVFNIKGNEYRLIVGINYEEQTIFYKYFLTHAEYDKDKWKNDPYF
jgi:mRNA interferase HigB